MNNHPLRYVFARILDGRVEGWYADGRPARLPLSRRECLVISRSDCDIVCMNLPRLSARRLRQRVADELQLQFPGPPSRYVYDYLLHPVGREYLVVVVLMECDSLSRYEAAAGCAPLTVLALLLRGNRRDRTHWSARGKGEAAGLTDGSCLLTWGRTSELVTVRAGNLSSSLLVIERTDANPAKESCDGPRPRLTPCVDGLPHGRSSDFTPRRRPSATYRLFEDRRGVPRWTRSPLLAPLFLFTALPLLLFADLTALSLLSRRSREVEALKLNPPDEIVLRVPVDAGREGNTPSGPPSPYLLLCSLFRTIGDSASVRGFSLSGRAAVIELLTRAPLEVLRAIESGRGVSTAELRSAGAPSVDGRVPTTLKVVFE